MDACEIGRCSVVRRAGGEVISGGRGGWFGFEVGEEIGDGDVAGDGDEVSSEGDITAVIFRSFGASLEVRDSPERGFGFV